MKFLKLGFSSVATKMNPQNRHFQTKLILCQGYSRVYRNKTNPQQRHFQTKFILCLGYRNKTNTYPKGMSHEDEHVSEDMPQLNEPMPICNKTDIEPRACCNKTNIYPKPSGSETYTYPKTCRTKMNIYPRKGNN